MSEHNPYDFLDDTGPPGGNPSNGHPPAWSPAELPSAALASANTPLFGPNPLTVARATPGTQVDFGEESAGEAVSDLEVGSSPRAVPDAEEEAATTLRASVVEPDLASVPDLSSIIPEPAPLASGDGGAPPSNGHYSTGLASWPPPDPNAPPHDKELDLFEHLAELRMRLLWCVGTIVALMFVTWHFGSAVQSWFARPIRQVLEHYSPGTRMITLDPTDGFMIYFQVSLVSALLIGMPIILWHLWRFIEPALTHQERRYTGVLLPFSVVLFFLGCLLGYWCAPLFFQFFLQFQPPDVNATYGYGQSIVLLAKMLLVFGVCFQVPVVTIFVNKIGLVSRNWLIEYWRHVVVVIFTVVAIITPTWDPITLIICSVPPCLLYGLSIWLVKWL